MEMWGVLEEPEKWRQLNSNGRFSQESGCSQAGLGGQETEESEGVDGEEWREEEGSDDMAHDGGGLGSKGSNNKNSGDGGAGIDGGDNSSNGDGCNNGNAWEDAVSDATTSAEHKTKGSFRDAARVLASVFCSIDDTFGSKDSIIGAIMQDLRPSDQAALEPDFVTSYRGGDRMSPRKRSR